VSYRKSRQQHMGPPNFASPKSQQCGEAHAASRPSPWRRQRLLRTPSSHGRPAFPRTRSRTSAPGRACSIGEDGRGACLVSGSSAVAFSFRSSLTLADRTCPRRGRRNRCPLWARSRLRISRLIVMTSAISIETGSPFR